MEDKGKKQNTGKLPEICGLEREVSAARGRRDPVFVADNYPF
jgi:hypothetical protein